MVGKEGKIKNGEEGGRVAGNGREQEGRWTGRAGG